MECIESRFQITTPTDIKICRGYLCLLHSNYAFLDRRGRRSLQGEIKLPYENQPFKAVFCLPISLRRENNILIYKIKFESVDAYF